MYSRTDRIAFIDALKCFAIFLVVCGHVLQYLQPLPYSVVPMYRLIYTFHMPLFMMLAGFFAANVSDKDFKAFFSGKAVRLLLPVGAFVPGLDFRQHAVRRPLLQLLVPEKPFRMHGHVLCVRSMLSEAARGGAGCVACLEPVHIHLADSQDVPCFLRCCVSWERNGIRFLPGRCIPASATCCATPTGLS